jgi:hypothetical protein
VIISCNSPIPLECRARLQKVNDINCYEVLAKGTDPFTISAILGHTNVQMTALCPIEGLSDYRRERLKIVSIEERRKQG